MIVTMDRYEADWRMVERGWNAHVLGEARPFRERARGDRDALRARSPASATRTCPPFVIADDGGPVGPIRDGAAVVLFNFRGDRAIEICARVRGGRASTEFDARRAGPTCCSPA